MFYLRTCTLIDWFIKYKSIIITSTAAIAAYTVTVNASTIATKLYETWTKLATVATRGFNTALKANPFGLAVAGLTAIATALITYVIPNTKKAKDEQKSYNDELEKMTKISDAFVNINKRADNLNKLNDRQKQNLKADAKAELAIIEDKLTKEEIAYSEQFEKEKKRIQARNDINETTRKVLMKGLDGKFKAQRQAIETLSKQRTELQNIIDKIPDATDTVEEPDPNPTVIEEQKATKENPQITAENKRYYDELADLKRTYLASDEMTQQEYTRFMEDLEMRHLENMMAIAGLEPEKHQQIEQKILEARIKYKEECNKLDEEDANKASEEAFTRLEKQYQLEIESVTQKHYAGLSSEQEYRQQLLDIQNEYYDQVLSSSEISEEKKAEIIDKKQQASLEKSRKNYEENQRKIREQLSFAQNIGQQFGEAFAEMLTDSETSLGDFMKATLEIILDSLQKMMIAYIAETQMKNIATLGFIGLAKAAAEIALITAAFQTAKAVINGFEEGGYTGSGRHDEPKGIVHAGEFVANRYAVQNPAIRPVLDLIDQAQRNNTIGSLTAKDVSAVLSPTNRMKTNNYYQTAESSSQESTAVMLQNMKCMEKLLKRLNEPIFTYTKATGKMGVNEAQQLVEKMKKNVTRTIKS